MALERGLVLQVATVRILKARKELSHNGLMEETIKAICNRFVHNVAEVEESFESLSERDYMERRHNGKQPTYRYIV